MRTLALLALAPLATGCGVDPVPVEIAEMMNFLFVHHADEEPEALYELTTNLHSSINAELDIIEADDPEDFAGVARWGGEDINNLTEDEINDAGVDKAIEEGTKIVGAAATVPYTHSLDLIAQAITWPNKTEVFSTLESYEILSETDLVCFLDQTCDTYSATVEQVAKVALVGKATQTQTWEHRWIHHPELGELYTIRVLTPDETKFSSGLLNVKQQYQQAIVFPEGDGGRRMEAFWAETKVLGGNLNEDIAQSTATNQMARAAQKLDEFIEGVILGAE